MPTNGNYWKFARNAAGVYNVDAVAYARPAVLMLGVIGGSA